MYYDIQIFNIRIIVVWIIVQHFELDYNLKGYSFQLNVLFELIVIPYYFFNRIFKSFAVMGEQLLPPKWPTGCHEATKLPFCPDFRTYKSSSSNNSGETPKHPRHHRSFSGICQKNLSKFSKRIYICPEIFQKNLSKICRKTLKKW